MAYICKNCNSQISEGEKFCGTCGTPVDWDAIHREEEAAQAALAQEQAVAQAQAQQQTQAQQQAQTAQPQYQQTPYQQPQYQQSGYQQQPGYQPNQWQAQPQYDKNENQGAPVTSIGQWLVMFLLCCIPLVGFIMLIVWACDKGNPSRANYCKAAFIWAAICIGIVVVLMILLIFVFNVHIATYGGRLYFY